MNAAKVRSAHGYSKIKFPKWAYRDLAHLNTGMYLPLIMDYREVQRSKNS